MIGMFDVVRTTKRRYGIPKGSTGTVVYLFEKIPAYLIEFRERNLVVSYGDDELEIDWKSPDEDVIE